MMAMLLTGYRQIGAKLISGVAFLVAVLLSGWAVNDGNATERVKTLMKMVESKIINSLYPTKCGRYLAKIDTIYVVL